MERMPEYVHNPRRSPRAPVACDVQLITGHGPISATTEDVGAHGAQVVCPRQLRRTEPVRLTLRHGKLKEALEVAGKVSWVSPQAPWRTGIAFDEAHLKAARRWYEKLVDANPGIPSLERVPDRIGLDQSIFLGPPPRWVVDLSLDEAQVLRAIGSGATLDDLRVKLRDRWGACQRAIFSLLAHRHVTLSRGEGVHPDAWKRILADLESSAALADLAPGLTPVPAAPSPGAPPRTRPSVAVAVAAATPAPAAEPAARPARSPDAQECYERGLAELDKGQIHTGVALLRRAAQLAPGDQEVTAALWKASVSAASTTRR
jgi:hypothetical protein